MYFLLISEGKDRPVWECDNPECLTVKLAMDCFWSSEGEFFGDSKEIVMRRNLGHDKSYSALDSSWEKIDKNCGKKSIKLSDADPKQTLVEELKKQHKELEERARERLRKNDI